MAWLKWFKRPIHAVIALLVVWVIWIVANREWTRREGSRDLVAAVAETDAADPNWRWDKLHASRQPVAADQNAADFIPKIKQLTTDSWGKSWMNTGPDSPPDPHPNVRYSARMIDGARKDLTASADAVKLARSLKSRPLGYREIVLATNPFATKLEDTMNTRHAAELLQWDAIVAAEDEDFARIADNLAAALNASRSVGDEPFLFSQLVRMGAQYVSVRMLERAIAQTGKAERLNSLRLAEFQKALADDADAPLLLVGLRAERAVFDIMFEKIEVGVLDMEGGPIGREKKPKEEFHLGKWLYRGGIPGDRAFALRWMNEAIEAARRPIHDQPAAFEKLPALPDDNKHILSKLLLKPILRIAVKYWKNVAETRCAIVGIACERYRLANGRWPAKLADLPAELLAAVALDPFNGEPLQYKTLEDGIVIYSIGPTPQLPTSDLEKMEEDILKKASAPRPGLPSGVKLGFRLWNPDQRRLPPPPEPPAPKDNQQP